MYASDPLIGEFVMSLNRLCVSALIFMALMISNARAQEPDIPSRLTLEAAIRLATSRHPLLSAAREEIRAYEGDQIAAGKRPNPSVSLEAEDYPIRAHPGPFFQNQAMTLRLDYEIERGGRRELRTEVAGRAVEVQRLEYQNQARLLKLEVERAFAHAILARLNLEAAQSLLKQTERMISLNRVRFEQGDISALELNRTEAEKLRFQDEVFQADLTLRNAKSALLALMHAPELSQEVEIMGDLQGSEGISEPGLPPQVSLEELLRIAMEHRPDLASRMEEDKRADAESLLQRALRSPNITVGGGYKRNDADNSFVIGVAIPLKIFNRNEGEIVRADAKRKQAFNLAAAARKQIELEVRQSYNAAEINRQRVEYIRTQHLEKAEEAGRVTFAAYKLGGAALIDYLDAQRTYRDTLRIYYQALYDARISLYTLASSIGMGGE
jgi:cobalt-zinc-cadmium efflux system outer membrane protein